MAHFGPRRGSAAAGRAREIRGGGRGPEFLRGEGAPFAARCGRDCVLRRQGSVYGASHEKEDFLSGPEKTVLKHEHVP